MTTLTEPELIAGYTRHCEHTIRQEAGTYGFRPVTCGHTVAVRVWYDERGTLHGACPDHIAARLHLYPESDPPEPVWLHEDPEYADDMTYAKWAADRDSWTAS